MAENRKEGEMAPPSAPSAKEGPEKQGEVTSKKGGKPKSNAWDHFTKFVDENGRNKAKCNYCGTPYFCDSKKNGTTALNNHMSKCKSHPCSSDLRQSQLSLKPILEEGGAESAVSGTLHSWRFDQDYCRIKLVEMIIKDEQPFRIVEGEGFREFVYALQPKFKIPSRWTISRDVYKMYVDERTKLMDFFQKGDQSVCITTDTWTSLQNINYMCITAHWIDVDWKLNKKIINFSTIESHKGENIGRQIDGYLREWGIKRVFSVTVDNASSNDTAIVALRNRLIARNCCLVGGRFVHMRCVAHIVNLVVKDGLKKLDKSIQRIRDAVKFVKQSPARIARFIACCKEENIECKSLLVLDVPTRWNSTYLMLHVACKFEKAFDIFELKDPSYKIELEKNEGVPEFVDWENAKKMSNVLKTFYDLTVRISGSLYVTSNAFLHEITNMYCLLKEWVANSTIDVRDMGVQMKEKFDKYWGDPRKMNKLIFFSVVVDPRYKFEVLEFILIEVYGVDVGESIAKSVKEELYELYEAYKSLHQAHSQASSHGTSQEVESSQDSTSSTPYLLIDKFKKQRRGVGDSVSNDLDVYLSEKERGVDDSKNFDITSWWKVNQPRLPILAHLARDVLSVPISTVASESAFSTGGRILDPFRSSLSPKLVESLICCQDWLRKSKEAITIEEDIEAIQKHEEALASLGIVCEEGNGDMMES